MATITEERLVAAATPALYMARRPNLRLVWRPIYNRYDAGGQKVGEKPGLTLQFREGVLNPVAEAQRLGVKVEEVVGFLEGDDEHQPHPMLRDVQEGFWRVDPVAPPVSQDEMRTINRLSMFGEREALEALVEQERAGWNREAILVVAQEAIEMLLEAERVAAESKGK